MAEITNDGSTGEITMNIKYALVNVIVAYTAMIGVASASPLL